MRLDLDASSLPAGAVIQSVTPRVRIGTGGVSQGVQFSLYDGVDGPITTFPSNTTVTTYTGQALLTTPSGAAWTTTAADALQLNIYAPR